MTMKKRKRKSSRVDRNETANIQKKKNKIYQIQYQIKSRVLFPRDKFTSKF